VRDWYIFWRFERLFIEQIAPAPLLEGAKSVQLAEACYRSHRERRWVELEPLSL